MITDFKQMENKFGRSATIEELGRLIRVEVCLMKNEGKKEPLEMKLPKD